MTIITLTAKNSRKISFFLLFVFISGLFSPNFVFALSEGPTQPELTKFSPVGSSDNVDLFTGDFKYSIPLFSIGGYPINLNYSGNIGMEDEASWVGLGWSLNPGAIQRNLRGLPDDFKAGDEIKKQTKTKPNVTISSAFKFKPGKEAMGWGIKGKFLNSITEVKINDLSVNVSFNNYKGLSINYGLGLGGGTDKLKCMDFGASLSSGNNSGLSFTPSLSLAFDEQENNNKSENDNSWELGAACSFNSETGLQDLTLNAGYNYEFRKSDLNANTGASMSFARQLYTPSIPIETNFQSYSGTLKLGRQLTVKNSQMKSIPVTYTRQTVNSDIRTFSPAGYMYMDENNYANDTRQIRDVSNEGSQGLSKHTKVIGYPVYSYDIFSINANGIGGQFKAERGNLGIITESSFANSDDNNGKTTVSPGIEFGFAPDAFQIGVDVKVNYFKESGGFDGNVFGYTAPYANLVEKYKFRSTDQSNKKFESVYFKMIGEGGMKWIPKDETTYPNDYVNKYASLNNPGIKVDKYSLTQQQRYLDFGKLSDGNPIKPFDGEREIRSTVIKCLTAKEASVYGLEKEIRYFEIGDTYGWKNRHNLGNPTGLFQSKSRFDDIRKEHHISEINVTDASGNRFVFGIPVYNLTKTEIQFSVAAKPGQSNANTINYLTGLVDFKKADITANDHGIDRYTNIETTSAYATSYLLTAWLAPDYQDIDKNGPSDNDLGNFVKFNYAKSKRNYIWRTPYIDRNKYQAMNEVLPDNRIYSAAINNSSISNDDDDRATYVTGERETFFVHSIESKEEIALFYINYDDNQRKDALPIMQGDHYGITWTGYNISRYLEKIEIYNKNELTNARITKRTPIPLKTVHFEYNYKLCPGVYNNENYLLWESGAHTDEGKLTLKKVWFTFGTSNKGESVPYEFEYDVDKDGNPVADYNPNYHPKGYDMWGNFKPQQNSTASVAKLTLDNSQFPFIDHNISEISQKINNDKYANAWCLHRIKLPSGAIMFVDYESDTYGYVQDKKAMNMIKIVGFGRDDQYDGNINLTTAEISAANDNDMLYENAYKPNNLLIFEMQQGYSVHDYIPDDMQEIFISCLLKLKQHQNSDAEESDYISGFYKLKLNGFGKPTVDELVYNDKNYGCVLLEWLETPALGDKKSSDEHKNDAGKKVHPITMRGLDYLLQNRQDIAYFGSNLMADNDGDGQEAMQYITAFLNVFPKLYNLVVGHYTAMLQRNLCQEIVKSNSWVRVLNPAACKYGGGNRVKRITITDNMEGEKEYGVEYDYNRYDVVDKKYKSSGVAAFEPVMGRSENPLFMPLGDEWHLKQALSRKHQYMYHHGPDLEGLYPGPTVGYSQVTMRTLYDENINRHATGRTVYQFYTAKDYPVKSEHSPISLERNKWPIPSNEQISAAQSFYINLNDMHGKMKSKFEYPFKYNQSLAANNELPFAPSSEEVYIAGEEYKYFEDSKHNLMDKIPYLDRIENKIKTGIFGREVEYYMNFRAENTFTLDCSVELNIIFPNTTNPIPIPIFSPVIPIPNQTSTDMRTYGITKVVRQYGILKEIIVHKDGSSLKTTNLGFDPQTGGVLLSSTQTEYGNSNYNLTIPAHWIQEYKGMGPAYANIGMILPVSITGGITADYDEFMATGDEFIETATNKRYWVIDINAGYASLMDEMGNTPANGNYNLKVIRSGFKNILSAPVASFTHSADNYVDIGESFHSEKFEVGTNNCKVLNASVNQYTQQRKLEHDPLPGCSEYYEGRVLELVNADIADAIGRLMKDKLESTGYFTNIMKALRGNSESTSPNYLRQASISDPYGNYEKLTLFEDQAASMANDYLSAMLVDYFKKKASSANNTLDKIELHWDYSENYINNFGDFYIGTQGFSSSNYAPPSSSYEGIIDYIAGIDFFFRIKVEENSTNSDCHYWMPFRDLDNQQERVYKAFGPSYFNNNLIVDVQNGGSSCIATGLRIFDNLATSTSLFHTSLYTPSSYPAGIYYTLNPYTWTYTMANPSNYVCGALVRHYLEPSYSNYEDLYADAAAYPSSLKLNAIYQNFIINDHTGTPISALNVTASNGNTEYAVFGTFHSNMKDAEFKPDYAYKVGNNSRSLPVINVVYNGEETIFPLIESTECVNVCAVCPDNEMASGAKINPFLNNILGQWMPSRQYSFFGSRNYLPPGSGTNYNQSDIKNEGYYKSDEFSSLIKDTLNTWIFERNTVKRKKWNYPENVTITDKKGYSIEGVNLLKTHSSLVMSKSYNDMVNAKISNAKKEQVINVNFEDHGTYLFASKSLCNFKDKLPFEDIVGNGVLIDQTESHSGRYSMKIESNAGGTGPISCKNIITLADQSRADEYNTGPIIRTMYKLKNQDFYNTFSPKANEKYVLSYWIKATDPGNFSFELQTNGTCSTFTSNITLEAVHSDIEIDGWIKREFTFQIGSTDPGQIQFYFNNQSGNPVYMDDFRIFPAKGNMVAYVYDQVSSKLSAQLDENNFARFYEYDAEGNLVRTKVETERGIMTINENRQNIKGNN